MPTITVAVESIWTVPSRIDRRATSRTSVRIRSRVAASAFASPATTGAAISVTGAVVSTGVKVTGKVIEKTIDVVTPGSPPEP